MLPDVVLLEIFDFYVEDWVYSSGFTLMVWHRVRLLHVCQKWRNVALGSPERLDLRLQIFCYRPKAPVKELLDIWPHLPIILSSYWHPNFYDGDYDRIYEALEHNDRLYEIELFGIPSSQTGKFLLAMQQPFPRLTNLELGFKGETTTVYPLSFFGGSAPSLRSLRLHHTPPRLVPKLLLSATHLVCLRFWDIPHFWYISPDTMASSLSVLTMLETLIIEFEFPGWKSQRTSPPTRILLPTLTMFVFKGAGEYLDDLVARIDAPLLNKLDMTFFHRLVFDTPRLAQFIGRIPKFKASYDAQVIFSDQAVSVTHWQAFGGRIGWRILCSQPDWQLSSLAQVCSSTLPPTLVHTIEHLYIRELSAPYSHDIESCQWLDLLRPFTAVKDLYLSPEFVLRILPALEELIREGVTELLPALQTLFLDEPLASGLIGETIARFVTARRSANHPIVVSCWKNDNLLED